MMVRDALVAKQEPRKHKKVLLIIVYVVFLLVLAEIFSFAAGTVLQSKWSMYRDPAPQPGKKSITYEKYLEIRDPDLGWPGKAEFGKNYDLDGARWCLESGVENPKFWALSLYGDSFTADHIGGDTDHWGCRLQRLTGAKVRNYGVGGYGTDQALIRYLKNNDDSAKVVILGHMSEDISRNLTRYRDFQNYTQNWAFKPRFVIKNDGELKQIPLPTLSIEEYNRFIGIKKPQLILANEYFHPNGPAGSVRLSFPYTLAVLRNFGFWELQSRLAGIPSYAPFYAEDHPFQGLQLTTAIMRRFVREAETRGQQAILVIFPGPADLSYFRENGRWLYQGLIDELHKEGLEPINFGETLIAYLEGRPIEEGFGTGDSSKRSHYNQKVSHLVADTILKHLQNSGLLTAEERITRD